MKNNFQFLNFKFVFRDILILGLLVTLFLFTRIYHLDKLPIFADEAIYVRWSQVMRAEPSLRFLPLQDGKQPLFMWLTIPFLKLISNPLIAGRAVSVLSGLVCLLGVLFLGRLLELRKNEIILLGLFYIWLPFALFFERMALVDSLLSAFGLWAFNLSLLLDKTERLDVAMILGFVLGGGLLTKSPAKLFIFLSLLTVIVQTIKRFSLKNLIKRVGLLAVSLFIAFMMYNILRLGPNFHMVGLRNQDYIWSLKELIKNPFRSLISNLLNSWRYYVHYLTWPVFILVLTGITGSVYKSIKEVNLNRLILLGWLIVPLFGFSALAKTFTARYILFTVPVLIPFIVFGLRLFKSIIPTKIYFLMLSLLFVCPFLFIYHLWNNPVKANLPQDEKKGYLQDWTAGWGLKDISKYLKSHPKDEDILVGTEGHFGTLPDGLQIYIQDQPNINVIGVGLPITGVPDQLKESKQAGNEVYLVVNESRFEISNWQEQGLVKVEEYNKPGKDSLLFFRLESK